MTVNDNLNNVILYHRKQAKLSREELAELAGVGKTVIFDIENGKQTVKWSTVLTVLHALNIRIDLTSPLMDEYEKSQSSAK